jgi:hypothetical protein
MKKTHFIIAFLFTATVSFSQSISTDTIHWSSAKALTWSDFKGDVNDTLVGEGKADIQILASTKKGSRFKVSTTYVVTVFDWRNSWVKPKSERDTYLAYFQVMFDIGELYSRKLRKSIKEEAQDAYPMSFEEKYNAVKIGFKDRCNQFNKESKLGTYDLAIKRWIDNVTAELAELDAYKQAPVKQTK